MASLNQVNLIGNLTRDPEIKFTPKGTAVATIGLALNHIYTNGAGEKVEEVCFVDCEAWGRTAEIAQEFLKKGSQCFLTGRLKLDQWDDKTTGQKRSRLRVSVDRLVLLGGKGGGNGRAPDDDEDPRGKPEDPPPGYRRPPVTSQQQQQRKEQEQDQPDDDIPF